jgi:hypothetical protein
VDRSEMARGARGRAKAGVSVAALPFGWFDFPPGANRLLGLWWAGKLLYPQSFADVDLRAKVTEFHRLFYHRDPTAAQLDALLGEPGVLAK